MPTESSAVSNLIHSLQTRRLQTDPGTASLFQPAPSSRAPRAQPVRPVAPSSRWFEHTPPTIAKPQPQRQAHAQARPRPRKRRRDRTWLLIVVTLLAGGLGVAGAAYFPFDSPDDGASFVPPVIVPAPAVAAPAPAPAPTVTPITDTAPDAITSAEPPPTTTTPAPVATTEPAKPHRRAHAKKKHAIARHVKTPKAAPAAEPADEEAPPPPAPAPAVHHGPSAQSDDSENPL